MNEIVIMWTVATTKLFWIQNGAEMTHVAIFPINEPPPDGDPVESGMLGDNPNSKDGKWRIPDMKEEEFFALHQGLIDVANLKIKRAHETR